MRNSNSATTFGGIGLYRDFILFIIITMPVFLFVYSIISGNVGTDEDVTDSSSSLFVQSYTILFFINAVFLAAVFKIPTRFYIIALLPLSFIILWSFISIGWSDFPSVTIRRASREAIASVSIILFALTMQNSQTMFRTMFWGFFSINILNLALMAAPTLSWSALGFMGIHFHKNAAGNFFFLALPIFAAAVVTPSISGSRLVAVFAFLAGTLMLILTSSKTAVVVTVFSFLLVYLTRVTMTKNVYGRIVFPIICLTLIALVLLDFFAYQSNTSSVFDIFFSDPTLTGRDNLWRYAVYKFESSPWLGVGYGAIWQVADVDTMLKNAQVGWIANQAHNGYLDALAQLGLIGIMLLILYLILMFIRIYKYIETYETSHIFGTGSYALYLFWGAILSNITETSFIRSGSATWMYLIFMTTQIIAPAKSNN